MEGSGQSVSISGRSEDLWPVQGGEAAHRPGQEGLHQAAGRLRDVKQAIGNHEQVPAQETIHISISKITKEGGSVGAPHPKDFFSQM